MDESTSETKHEPGWVGLMGAIGGCLSVFTTIFFCLCLGSCMLGSLEKADGSEFNPAFPLAVPAFYAFAILTAISAVVAGTSLGIRVFSQHGVNTLDALRATFASALLPMRYVIGAIQGIAMVSICPIILLGPGLIWWAIGAFVVSSIIQILLLVAIRILAGPGAASAVLEQES